MTDSRHIFDPGLQAERTLLAWRRTCLTLVVGSAVALRFAVGEAGVVAVIGAVSGLAVASAAWVVATRRYRRAHTSLIGPGDALALGGVTVTAVAAVTMILVALGFLALTMLPL